GALSEVSGADDAGRSIGVPPRTKSQLLIWVAVARHFQEIQLGADRIAVKPAGLVKYREAHVSQFVQKITWLPIAVISRMFNPFAPVRILFAKHSLIQLDDWKRPQKLCIFLPQSFTQGRARDVGSCPTLNGVGPPDRPPEKEYSILIRAVVERIRRRDIGNHRHHVRRPVNGGPPLRRAGIGSADHSHFSVRVRLAGKPFNRVITIFAFVDEWLPDARRAESPATVLRRKYVAAPGIEFRLQF